MKRASLIIPNEMIFNGYKMKKKKKNNNNWQTKKAAHISICVASNSVTAIDRNNALVLSFYAGTHESMTIYLW